MLATIVMSVDLTPAVSFVRDHRIPERLRQVLNAESGLNDGIVAPTFLFCLAAATAAGSEAQADAAIDAVPPSAWRSWSVRSWAPWRPGC